MALAGKLSVNVFALLKPEQPVHREQPSQDEGRWGTRQTVPSSCPVPGLGAHHSNSSEEGPSQNGGH